MDASLLTGKTVINLDTEVLGEICISSAGGARANVSQKLEADTATYEQNTIAIKEMR
ncbi:hypothetical protein KBC03_05525 [Patescibacteria group bacterium]|nr:hypothetical protein [Patescibacteria group bacterium]